MMGTTGRVSSRGDSRHRGSAVLFALFACLTVAVIVQVVVALVVCAERVLTDEDEGRRRLHALDMGLRALLDMAAEHWMPRLDVDLDDEAGAVEGSLIAGEGSEDWLMIAQVRDVSGPPHGWASMVVERGRDGVDLPMAALVAASARWADTRTTPWLVTVEAGREITEPAIAWLRHRDGTELVDLYSEIRDLVSVWSLGQGWVESLREGRLSGERVRVMQGERGEMVLPSQGAATSSAESPIVVVVIGGADLDLRGRGELWGVVIVDGGSVSLDGTTVHGAVFAGGNVDFGMSGQVVFSSDTVRWARDRSLERARLVPGTREEGNG